MWNRHIAHERQADLKTFAGHHYNIAAKALPQNRHTIPLCMWERDAINNESERFLNLAEQTIMLALETYHPSVHTTGSQNITMYPYASKASFLRGFAKKARESTGWGPMPNLKYIGCNMDSPLFSFFRGLRMNCFRMTSPDPAVRTFTTYRTWCPIQHLPTTDHVKIGYYPDTTANISPICFTPRDRINKSISRGYLVFEIMDDGHPHDRPWLGVPTVGTYENFARASSLGVRFEWFDEKQDTWLTVPIERQRHNSGGAGSWSTAGYLSVWKLAITIIQLVEGVTWTQPSIGFEKIPSLRAVRVMEFSINHLQQTCQWVPRARSTSPAPKLATWVHNFDHMRRIFANDMTIVGPSQPPGIHDSFWRLTESDSRRMSRMKTICCDLCNYSARPSNDHKCERDETRSDIWVCKFCSLLNRPCTFTPPNRSKELWGDTPPLLHHLKRSVSGTGWSRYPSGPHRFLAFHHAIHMNELTTPVRVGTPWETRFEVDLGEEPKVEDIGDAVDSEVDD
ncbi:hypothetical protein EDB80DRAFT_574000 [Ilyonectria destructans]|nr:hypothetical protein EDB80DRAFT_574000 [Ilyonectria destructans]